MIASSILMGIICTVLTERFVEPRLGPYTGGVPVEATEGLSGSEQRGLKYAGRALLGFVVVIGLPDRAAAFPGASCAIRRPAGSWQARPS